MICTFYSYKGGVGRSMAMANVADLLSRRGLRVLMVDFDLEAPGLEQFFRINHDAVRRHFGLLDLLLSYKHAMSLGGSGEPAFKNVESFIVPIHERLPQGGCLALMPAGQRHDAEQLARYAASLRTFDWQDFYFDWQGGLFFEWLRRTLVPERYDLVLIDSRTGVTEMGGICGYQLADCIVMLCSANQQNIQGTRNMLRDFRSPAVEALRRGRRLDIVLVPARIEQRDAQALDAFYARFEREFGELWPAALSGARLDFRALAIPYEPRIAFEERIVDAGGDGTPRREIGAAFERLAEAVLLLCPEAIGGGRVSTVELWNASRGGRREPYRPSEAFDSARQANRSETSSEGQLRARGAEKPARARVAPAPARLQYDAAKRFADYDVFVDASAADRDIVEVLVQRLRAASQSVFVDREDMTPGSSWQEVVEEALFRSQALYFCIGSGGLSKLRLRTLELARKAYEKEGRLRVVPVLLPGADAEPLREPDVAWLGALPWLDLRGGLDVADVGLGEVPSSVAASIPAIEAETRAPFVGLRPFSEAQADLFFGRESAAQRLLELLLARHGVLVVGPSGCGKTSLINAGLVPALRRNESAPALRVVSARVGAHPRDELLRSLSGSAENERGEAGSATWLAALPLPAAIRAACEAAAPGALLVVIDPLEEVFLLPDASERQAFLEALAEVVAAPPANLYLVMALRSSFQSNLRQQPAWAAWLSGGVFEVPDLSPEELRTTLEYPVERVGAAFEPGVVDSILREARAEPSALPMLQGLLAELWQERRDGWLTNDALAKLGGLGGLLALQAERVHAALSPDERQALRWIMLRLVRPGQRGEETRRRLPLDDLVPEEARRKPELGATYRSVGLKLVEARVLTASEEGEQRIIEPAHEALVRRWNRLRGWVAEEQEFLAWRDRLGVALADWRNHGRSNNLLLQGATLLEAERWSSERGGALNADEHELIASSRRHRERRRRLVRSAGAGVVLTTLALVAGVALLRLRVSEAQAEAAIAQRSAAEAHSRLADTARAAAEHERDIAQKERAIAESRLAIAEDTIEELRQASQALRKLADKDAPRASAAEKRAQAGRELKRLETSIDALQGRVDNTKTGDLFDEPK